MTNHEKPFPPVCVNPEDCCKELSHVWVALGSPTYDGRSAHEHVAALRVASGDDEPTDLLDAVYRLDDLADWLSEHYPDEAAQCRQTSQALKGYIVISLPAPREEHK